MNIHGFNIELSYESSLWTASLKMAAERYLSRRIPDLRVGNNIDEIDKKLIPASIHPCIKPLSCGIRIYPVLENIVDPDQLAFQEQTSQDLYGSLSCI